MKKTLFLIFSAAIVIFSVICIGSSPLINKVTISNAYNSLVWGYLNCKKESDNYKKEKDTTPLTGDAKDQYLKTYKYALNLCNRKKAVYGLEHASLIIDVFLGFLCLILGLLHYFDVGKPFEKVTGIIGLATGIIQFILTLVFVCYSGYIFTNDGPIYFLKVNSNGVAASYEDSYYKCKYYDKDDPYSIYAKYSDLWKKAYNYDKDFYNNEPTNKAIKCPIPSGFLAACFAGDGKLITNKINDCDELYYAYRTDEVGNKYLYDRWVTTIIFACFIFVCDIGLAIFGFFLFKSDGSGI